MVSKEVTVALVAGLHARPAMGFAKLAATFQSEIRIECKGKSGSAKSVVSVLKLGACCGATIRISAQGEDEETALAMLEKYVETPEPEETA